MIYMYLTRISEYECQTKSQIKGEKGMGNLGVWQLSLFNILEHECTNSDNFLGVQGRRGLNTIISKKIPLRMVVMWGEYMYSEYGMASKLV